LLFSRSSFIGAHRNGGVWQGDNFSWWSHLKMALQMLPGLNMCGFLYSNDDKLRFLGVAIFFQLADFILTPDKEVLVHNDYFSGAKIEKISYQTQVRKHCFFIGFRT
ncbi:MAG: hypothetical protein K5882_12445, partial [Bacteroidales bacterium]|nr:hypothetical protein [Bacteroidales bacterium]